MIINLWSEKPTASLPPYFRNLTLPEFVIEPRALSVKQTASQAANSSRRVTLRSKAAEEVEANTG